MKVQSKWTFILKRSHNSESSEVKQDSLLNSNFCILYIFSVEDLHE